MKKGKVFQNFVAVLIGVFLLTGCSDNQKEETQLGSAIFKDYTIEISENGKDIAYTKYKDQFTIKAVDFPVKTNYCAIYDGKLYYTDVPIDFETGENVNRHCTIYSCELDGQNPKSILEISDGDYIDIFIQEGMLYCCAITSTRDTNQYIVDLSSETVTKINQDKKYTGVHALTKEGYYYHNYNEDKIYYCDYDKENVTLFCEPDGNIQSLYRNNNNLYVLLRNDIDLSLAIYDNTGNYIESYNISDLLGDLKGPFIDIIRAEGDILYFELVTGRNDSLDNTYLICMNLKDGTKKVCGSWYTP